MGTNFNLPKIEKVNLEQNVKLGKKKKNQLGKIERKSYQGILNGKSRRSFVTVR
jgi:hypothetical protein